MAWGFPGRGDVRITSLTPARAMTLSKISHEAVSNMIRHAMPGSEVSIRVFEEDGWAKVEYVNPLNSKKRNQGRFGLLGLDERMIQVQGSLVVDDSGGYWRLRIAILQSAGQAPDEDVAGAS